MPQHKRVTKESVLVLNKYFLAVQVSYVQKTISALVTGKARVLDEEYVSYTLKDWVAYTREKRDLTDIANKYPGLVRSPSITIFAPQVVVFPDCEHTKPLIEGIRYSRKNVFQRDNFTCQYCGERFQAGNLNIDHIVPRSRGGPNSWKNVVTSCKPCNNKKGDQLLTELGWKLIQQPTQPRWKSHVGKPFSLNKKQYWERFLK